MSACFLYNAVKSYMFSRKKSLSKECSICREDLMRRTLLDSLHAIDPCVCLFSFLMQWRANVFSRKKEESIKGMLNLQRGFDAKDITGFFGCHRSVRMSACFLINEKQQCTRERNAHSADRISMRRPWISDSRLQ